jgi:hypothetical protein
VNLVMREGRLKIALILVGLLFTAAIYPAVNGLRRPVPMDYGDDMLMGLYFVLGVFLLLAVRNPSDHRSLIAFATWSGFAHAAVMGTLGLRDASMRTGFLGASGILVLIGVVLLALLPPKPPRNPARMHVEHA